MNHAKGKRGIKNNGQPVGGIVKAVISYKKYPGGSCIQELADRIQKAETKVPVATVTVAKKMHFGA